MTDRDKRELKRLRELRLEELADSIDEALPSVVAAKAEWERMLAEEMTAPSRGELPTSEGAYNLYWLKMRSLAGQVVERDKLMEDLEVSAEQSTM